MKMNTRRLTELTISTLPGHFSIRGRLSVMLIWKYLSTALMRSKVKTGKPSKKKCGNFPQCTVPFLWLCSIKKIPYFSLIKKGTYSYGGRGSKTFCHMSHVQFCVSASSQFVAVFDALHYENFLYSNGNKFVIFCFALLIPQILDNFQKQGQFWNLLVLTISKHPLHVQFDQVLAEIF